MKNPNKSHTAWNKGLKTGRLSKEHRMKIGLAQLGRQGSFQGKKLSQEHKNKISKSLVGRKSGMLNKKHSEVSRKKMSKIFKNQYLNGQRVCCLKGKFGQDSIHWKGGLTPLYLQIRHHFKSRQWSSDIFSRDNFTCQECGGKGYVEAHHIKKFADILKENNIKKLEEALTCEELWNLNNGITLCRECHKQKRVIRH